MKLNQFRASFLSCFTGKFQNKDDDRNSGVAPEESAFVRIEPIKHQEVEEEEEDPLTTNLPIGIAVGSATLDTNAEVPIDNIKCELVSFFFCCYSDFN